MRLDNGPFAVWQRNPETGERLGRLNSGLTRQMVADFLASGTDMTAEQLAKFYVEHSTATMTAETFLEVSAAEAVRAAWKKASRRQRELVRDVHPELGLALGKLEGLHAE